MTLGVQTINNNSKSKSVQGQLLRNIVRRRDQLPLLRSNLMVGLVPTTMSMSTFPI